jgi:hypothetical protein
MSELAPSEVVELLDADVAVEKRAQWGGFEFTLLGDGDVEVVNTSHEEPSEHSYTVHVESGIPSDCTCPAFEYQDGACKHMAAVAIRESLLEAVSAEPTLKPDGGVAVEEVESEHSDERPDDCDCSPLFEDLYSRICYRNGFERPNPNVEEDKCVTLGRPTAGSVPSVARASNTVRSSIE